MKKQKKQTLLPKKVQKKILVVYFSATGNTKRIAQIIASDKNADIFEIIPENPYTAEDLNSKNSDSKVAKEKADKSIRPKIKNSEKIFNQYVCCISWISNLVGRSSQNNEYFC